MRLSTGDPVMSSGERFRRVVRALLPWNLYIRLTKMLDAGYCISILGFREFLRLRVLYNGSQCGDGDGLAKYCEPELR